MIRWCAHCFFVRLSPAPACWEVGRDSILIVTRWAVVGKHNQLCYLLGKQPALQRWYSVWGNHAEDEDGTRYQRRPQKDRHSGQWKKWCWASRPWHMDACPTIKERNGITQEFSGITSWKRIQPFIAMKCLRCILWWLRLQWRRKHNQSRGNPWPSKNLLCTIRDPLYTRL